MPYIYTIPYIPYIYIWYGIYIYNMYIDVYNIYIYYIYIYVYIYMYIYVCMNIYNM